jgi:hypothetical protein
MRSIRPVIRQSPAVVISMAALFFAVGGGAGYAATAANTASTTITLHALPLGKGWTGALKYGVSNGVVYLDGNAGKSSGSFSCLTTVPKGARPSSSQIDIPVTFGAEGAGLIQVLSDGQVCAFPPQGGDDTFVSLAGVSFPVGA